MTGADPGVVSGGSVEPPKVKQTQVIWPYFFLWKNDLLNNNKQLDNVGGRLSEPPLTKSWIRPR